MVLDAAVGKSMFGLMQDLQLIMESLQMALCDPYTKQVIPEGRASLVDWVKATVRSVFPEKGDCPVPPINAK